MPNSAPSSSFADSVAERRTDLTDHMTPLLFQRREAIVLDPRLGSTTTCQTTMASDWTPDD